MMAFKTWIIAVMIPLMDFAQTTPNTAFISGIVADEAGKPVAGATLVYRRLTNFGPSNETLGFGHNHLIVTEPGFNKVLNVGPDGHFMLSGLRPG